MQLTQNIIFFTNFILLLSFQEEFSEILLRTNICCYVMCLIFCQVFAKLQISRCTSIEVTKMLKCEMKRTVWTDGHAGGKTGSCGEVNIRFSQICKRKKTGNISQSKFCPVPTHCKILRPFGSCNTRLNLQSSMSCWLCVCNSCLPYGSQNKQQFLPVQN